MELVKKAPHISFDDITLSVRDKHGTGDNKVILNRISGFFPSGQLVGILGPSGAGKSSLLNILSGWDRRNKITGSIKINQRERQLNAFKSISCYITQDSYLNDILTVEENLLYAADLKLGPNVSATNKLNLIDQVLDNFGLTETKKTKTSKLSGGQRKRLAICLELLSDPDIIFLDEPTTGLDIVSTFQCMQYLKNLTKQGNTVVCTLHQPPDNIFRLFDMVYIISNGKCAYQGGVNNLVQFLDDNGVPCGIFYSPLDFIAEIANGDYGEKVLETVLQSSRNGKNHDYMPVIDNNNIVNKFQSIKSNNIFSKLHDYSIWEDFYEFRTLMKREYIKLSRDIFLTYLRVLGLIFNSTMTGLICYGMGGNATKLYFNYNMVLLQISNLVVGCSLLTTVSFALNKNIVKNEYLNGYYSIRNYFFTNVILDIPLVFAAATIGSALVYWLSGQLMTWDRIIMFLIICFEIGMVGSALGFLVGSILGINQSIFVVTSIHIPIFLFSGFGLSITDFPKHFYFLTHFAYTRYAVRTLMGIIFGYDRPMATCPEDVVYCHYQNTKIFLDEMGLEDYYFVYDTVAIMIFYVLIRLLAYAFIRYRLTKGV